MTDTTASATAAPLARLPRKFRFGVTVLEDIDPSMTPAEVLRHYEPNYPFLANATVGEPEELNGALVFAVQKPVVQTKGVRATKRAQDDAIARIEAWASADPDVSASPAWADVHARFVEIATAPATPIQSAFLPLI